MSDKKITILTLSDHPLSPSGVGTQTKYMIEAMLATGKYRFLSLGGAISHPDYKPIKTKEWGDDWIILPVDNYGTQDLVRSIIRNDRPDILWFMTDPRFWPWLWAIENEIRPVIPMIYYHVWDNYPYPTFNRHFYLSNDIIATISGVTKDIIETVVPEVKHYYVPHVINTDVFKKQPEDAVKQFKHQAFPEERNMDKVVFFWNSRNARRKQSGSLIYWFKAFLDKVGHDKACLIMHTDPKDSNGQDLDAILHDLNLHNKQVMFSKEKYPPEVLAMMYNMADCTICISDAEGFGLSTLESLACETPIIVNMTGGLQDQITDGKEWFGIGIEPTSKAIIGSQDVPYIYEDRLSEEAVVNALLEMYNKTKKEREKIGKKARKFVMDKFALENYTKKWDEIFTYAYNELGSWENRKNYKGWELKEIV